jgi:hypothetical protein
LVRPAIAAGAAFTLTTAVETQPEAIVYDIVALPAEMPVAMPVTESIEATEGALLLQRPPGTALYSGLLRPVQMNLKPVTGASDLTVTVVVAVLEPQALDVV